MSIFGPTASGKTELNSFLSSFLEVEFINVDSVQIYKNLNIATAKPSLLDRVKLKYHMIDIKEICDDFNAVDFVELCKKKIKEIESRNKIPILSGGSPFYFLNFFYGSPCTPKVESKIKSKVNKLFEEKTRDELFELLQNIDLAYSNLIHKNDTHRLKRAFEIYFQTGKAISSFNNFYSNRENEFLKDYDLLNIYLNLDKEILHKRIKKRFEIMIEEGLLEEIKFLFENKYNFLECKSLKSIGYKEFLSYPDFDSCIKDLEIIKEKIITNTKRYAKRQKTFFSKIKNSQVIFNFNREEIKEKILNFLL